MKTQKKYLSILCLLLLSTGCKKADKLTQFKMEYEESAVIPSSTGISVPFNILIPPTETNSETTFEVNNTRKDLIEEIKLSQLSVALTSPTNGNFNFLNSIGVYINANGLPETKIAGKDSIPSQNLKVIELDSTGADFQEYIKADQFTLRLNTVTDELLTSDYHVDLAMVFWVNAKLLKKK